MYICLYDSSYEIGYNLSKGDICVQMKGNKVYNITKNNKMLEYPIYIDKSLYFKEI